MKVSSTLHLLIVIACAVFVAGVATGYYAHGKPAPTPSVAIATVHAHVATAAAAKAETAAHAAQHGAIAAIALYDSARGRDTVVVDSIVYVAAAPADSAIQACSESVIADGTALALSDTARAALASVIAARAADQPSRIGVVVTGAYEPITHLVSARAETVVRITDRFSVGGEASRGFSPTDPARLSVLGHWTFR